MLSGLSNVPVCAEYGADLTTAALVLDGLCSSFFLYFLYFTRFVLLYSVLYFLRLGHLLSISILGCNSELLSISIFSKFWWAIFRVESSGELFCMWLKINLTCFLGLCTKINR
ncbi:hypothetical protein RND81_07G147000 [Saponaria officinalis]|uniref:Uncharacterized protein n=1 Tax=Saponaria officinalis TaxID=3572 RepID=A0AAW1JR21_SAPOF